MSKASDFLLGKVSSSDENDEVIQPNTTDITGDSAWKYINAGDISGFADWTNRNMNYRDIPFLGQLVGHTADAATQGVADLAQFAGAEGVGNYLNEKAQEGESRLAPMSTPELSLNYVTDPNGLTSATGMLLGSMLSMAPATMLVPEAAALRAGALLKGLPKVGGFASEFAPKAVKWAATGPIEAAMEGGNTERQMLESGASREEANRAKWDAFKGNVALLTATNALEGGLLGKVAKVKTPTFENGILNTASKAAGYLPATAAESALQGYEEGAQQGIQEGAMSGAMDLNHILNPNAWNDEQWENAKFAVAGGLPMVGGSALIRRFGGNTPTASANELLEQAQASTAQKLAADSAPAQAEVATAQPAFGLVSDAATETQAQSGNALPTYDQKFYTIADEVSDTALDADTEARLNILAHDYQEQFGEPLYVTSMKRNGDGSSWHDSGQAFDIAGGGLETNENGEREWLIQRGQALGLTPLDEYAHPSEHATGGHIHFSNHEDGSAPSIGGTQGGAVDVSSLTGGNIAMAISQRTGLPAQFIWAQMAHESANFQSDLARKDHNYAGVKGTDGEYLHFDSDEDFVNYMADYLPKYSNNGIFNAKNVDEYAQALKDGGYFSDTVENYAGDMKNILSRAGLSQSGRSNLMNDKPSFDINRDDETGRKMVADFVSYWSNATDNADDMNELETMLDRNGKFRNTPENRANVREKFGDAYQQFADARMQEEAKKQEAATQAATPSAQKPVQQAAGASPNAPSDLVSMQTPNLDQTANRKADTNAPTNQTQGFTMEDAPQAQAAAQPSARPQSAQQNANQQGTRQNTAQNVQTQTATTQPSTQSTTPERNTQQASTTQAAQQANAVETALMHFGINKVNDLERANGNTSTPESMRLRQALQERNTAAILSMYPQEAAQAVAPVLQPARPARQQKRAQRKETNATPLQLQQGQNLVTLARQNNVKLPKGMVGALMRGYGIDSATKELAKHGVAVPQQTKGETHESTQTPTPAPAQSRNAENLVQHAEPQPRHAAERREEDQHAEEVSAARGGRGKSARPQEESDEVFDRKKREKVAKVKTQLSDIFGSDKPDAKLTRDEVIESLGNIEQKVLNDELQPSEAISLLKALEKRADGKESKGLVANAIERNTEREKEDALEAFGKKDTEAEPFGIPHFANQLHFQLPGGLMNAIDACLAYNYGKKNISFKGLQAFIDTITRTVDYGGKKESRLQHIERVFREQPNAEALIIQKLKGRRDLYGNKKTDYQIYYDPAKRAEAQERRTRNGEKNADEGPFEYITKAEYDYFEFLKSAKSAGQLQGETASEKAATEGNEEISKKKAKARPTGKEALKELQEPAEKQAQLKDTEDGYHGFLSTKAPNIADTIRTALSKSINPFGGKGKGFMTLKRIVEDYARGDLLYGKDSSSKKGSKYYLGSIDVTKGGYEYYQYLKEHTPEDWKTEIRKMRAESAARNAANRTRDDFVDNKISYEDAVARINAAMDEYAKVDKNTAERDRKWNLERLDSINRDKHPEIEAAEKVAADKAEREAYHGFLDNKTNLAAGNAKKALSVRERRDGQALTRKDYTEQAANDQAYNMEKAAYKGKTQYRLFRGKTFTIVTKTEYDYFNYLRDHAGKAPATNPKESPLTLIKKAEAIGEAQYDGKQSPQDALAALDVIADATDNAHVKERVKKEKADITARVTEEYKTARASIENFASSNGERRPMIDGKSYATLADYMKALREKRKNDLLPDQFDKLEALAKRTAEDMERTAKSAAKAEESAQDSIFGDKEQADRELLEELGINPDEEETLVAPEGITNTAEVRAQLEKELSAELNKISANPVFNPKVYELGVRIAFTYVKDGMNTAKKLIATLNEKFSDAIAPWSPAIVETVRTWPQGVAFDAKTVRALSKAVGAHYEQGTQTREGIHAEMKELFKGRYDSYAPMIDAAYNGIEKFFNAKEAENNGHGTRPREGADRGHEVQQPREVRGTEEEGQPRGHRGGVPVEGEAEEGRVLQDDGEAAAENAESVGSVPGNEPHHDGDRGNGERGNHELAALRDDQAKPAAEKTPGHDYTIEGDGPAPKTPKQRFDANVEAIKLLKQLEAEGRMPTPAEQSVLAAYSSWGGLTKAFQDGTKENTELRKLLTKEEYDAAKRSILDAYFTPPAIVRAIWKGVSSLGFKGGRVLDPSMGVGNFFGCMPESMRKASALTGVEIDDLSSRFANMLYPSADVEHAGFQNAHVADDSCDLVISNVPFSQAKIGKYALHNYFFANGIDKVRPGGLMVFITSQSSLTSGGDAATMRAYLNGHADLIGGFKLPSGVFKGTGTDVATDVLVFQKRGADGKVSPHAKGFTNVMDYTFTRADGSKAQVPSNKYFYDNPGNVLGKKELGRDRFGKDAMNILPRDGQDTAAELAKAMAKLPNVYEPVNRTDAKPFQQKTADKKARADEKRRDMEYFTDGGKLYQNQDGVRVAVPTRKAKAVKAYLGVRESLRTLFLAENDPDAKPSVLDSLRKKLNQTYDAFVKAHGFLNEPKNVRLFGDDPNAGSVLALETDVKLEGNGAKRHVVSAQKAGIFHQRTVQAVKPVTHTDNAKDALLASLNQTGKVDVDYMAKLTGKPKADVIRELGDTIYQDPATETYETADEYLSGNVREKLAQAQKAAKKNPTYQRNVDALKKVVPADLVSSEILVNINSPWIPVEDLNAFMEHLTGASATSWQGMTIARASNGRYVVDGSGYGASKWKPDGVEFRDLIDSVLNNKPLEVAHKDEDGHRIVDQEKTDAANAAADRIRDEFQNWIWSDKTREQRLAKYYNENYNGEVLRTYDGSHLTFPGMNSGVKLRGHQKNVIWRMLQKVNTLIAHCVGAGKTWEMQAAGMEMRRLGIANKPLYCVPNNIVEQFAREFQTLYPNAKLLVLKTGDDLPEVFRAKVTKTEDGRKVVHYLKPSQMSKADRAKYEEKCRARLRALTRIKTEDWDGIIMSHNMFERLPVSGETTAAYIKEEIAILEQTLKEAEARKQRGKNANGLRVRDLQTRLETLKSKLEEATNQDLKAVGIPFEELGIDQIFVDEADMFKNLHFMTTIGDVSGLTNPKSANRSTDMFIKTQWLTKRNGGRGVVFATGTPISNTMAEMYTMMRYLDSAGLKERGVELFDNWIRQYGDIGTGIERKPSGDGYRKVQKVKHFLNMPELTKAFRKFTDVFTRDELIEEDPNITIPKLKNDKRTVIALAPDPAIVDYIKRVVPERIKNMKGRGKQKKGDDNMLALTNDLRKLSMTDKKIDACAEQVAKKYRETDAEHGAQAIFCDMGVPRAEKENATSTDRDANESAAETENKAVYDRLIASLVAHGIPREQIAFAQQAKNKQAQDELFQKVDRGDIRVIIGTTQKMGAGTNFQRHLAAEHHLDAPWRPRDIEQREGRILRQGNGNKEVEIFTYVVKDSFDANMWEKIKNKASIISQAMSPNIMERSLEDADLVTLSYADVESAATGNPYIKQMLDAKADVAKLTNASTQFQKQQHDAERKAKELPATIKNEKNILALIEEDKAARIDTHGDKFQMEIAGKTYDKRADADKALDALPLKTTPQDVGHIGEYRIRAWVDMGGETNAEIVRNRAYPVKNLNAQSIERALRDGVENAADSHEVRIKSQQQELKDAKDVLKEQNPYTEKLKAAREQLRQLEQKINDYMTKKPQATDTAPTASATPTETEAEPKETFDVNKTPFYISGSYISYEGKLSKETYDALEKLADKDGADKGSFFRNEEDGNFSVTFNYRRTNTKRDTFIRDAMKLIEQDKAAKETQPATPKQSSSDNFLRDHIIVGTVPKETRTQTEEAPSKPTHYEAADVFRSTALWNPTTGKTDPNAKLTIQADHFTEDALETIADSYGGDYDPKQKRFFFDNAESRDKFVRKAMNFINGHTDHVHYSVSEAKERVARTTEDLKREIAAAFPDAKNIKDEGDRVTFDMPNGSHVEIRIRDNMTLTGKEAARARRDHGIADGVSIRVNGSEYTLGRDVVMELSRRGDAGTAYHEALHAAMDILFDDKAKAALHKKYGSEEKIADAYRKFMLAEQRGGHVPFAKLFRAIRDFFRGLASHITPIREKFGDAWTAQKAFEDLASGKAWEPASKKSHGFSLFSHAEAAERPIDNEAARGDNEVKKENQRIEQKNQKVFESVQKAFLNEVQKLRDKGWKETSIARAMNDENSAYRKAVVEPFARVYNQFHVKGSNKRDVVQRILGEKAFADLMQKNPTRRQEAVAEVFQQLSDRMEGVMNDARKTCIELADRFGNGQDVAGLHSWRDIEASSRKHHGGAAFTEHPAEVNHEQHHSVSRSETQDGFSDARKSDKEYMDAVDRYQTAATDEERAQALSNLQSMVQEAAENAGFQDAIPEQTKAYRIRTGKAPQKTLKVYKVFTVAPDGAPTALFVSGTEKLPQGVWLDAQAAYHFTANNGKDYVPSTQNPYTKGGKTGGTVVIPSEEVRQELIERGFLKPGSTAKNITALAYRPGWHAGTLPFFPQGGKKNAAANYGMMHRANQVVFECELAADKDYTQEARSQEKARTKEGKLNLQKADLQYLPENGFYYYATNPLTQSHPELGAWAISGSLKINRALTQEECDRILAANNMKPQAWEQGKLNLADLGYTGEQNDAARKTLAPITYDDAGEVIPLSERFNAESPDVRYSISEEKEAAEEEEETAKRGRSFVKAAADKLGKALHLKSDKIMLEEDSKDPTKDINLKQAFLQSPSRVAAKVPVFRAFYTMACRAMDKNVGLRNDFNRKFDGALAGLKKAEREELFDTLLKGDAEGKEWTRDDLIADGASEAVADAYIKIRRQLNKAYHLVDKARRKPEPKSKSVTEDELKFLRENKFVDNLHVTDKGIGEDGKHRYLASYMEARNYKRTYKGITADRLAAFQADDGIQVVTAEPAKSESGQAMYGADGKPLYNVITAEGPAHLNKLTGYIPHFFHEYMIRVVDKDGKARVVGSARNQREAIKVGEAWLKENELADGEEIHVAPKVFDINKALGVNDADYAPVMGDRDFYRVQANLAKQNDMTLAEAKEMLDGAVRLKGRHRFFGNAMHRTGAQGYEADLNWALRHYFNSASRYVAMETEFKPKAISYFERMFGAFDKDYTGLAKYCKDYINDINGNPSALEEALNKALNSTWLFKKVIVPTFGDRAALTLGNGIATKVSYLTLGLNMSSALLNFTQLANAAAYIGDVSSLVTMVNRGRHHKYSRRDLRILHETGVFNDIGLDSGSGYDKMRSGAPSFGTGKFARGLSTANRVMDFAGNKSMMFFREADAICRRGTVLAAYKKARKEGKTHAEAIAFAKEVNDKANFQYGVQDAPNIFRRGSIVSQLLLQFKKYGFKELEVMADFAPWSKVTNKKQKLMFWAMYAMLCGAMGVPALDWLDEIFGEKTGFYTKDEMQKAIIGLCGSNKTLAAVAMYGVPAILGMNISSRAGLSDVIPTSLGDFAGPTASKSVRLAQDMLGGDWANALRDVSPGLYNLYAGYSGESRGKRGRLNDRYTTAWDRILRAVGFRSVEESVPVDMQRIISRDKAALTKERQAAQDAYIENPTSENKARLKELGINPKTVTKEAQKKQLTREERMEGSVSKKDAARYKPLTDYAKGW